MLNKSKIKCYSILLFNNKILFDQQKKLHRLTYTKLKPQRRLKPNTLSLKTLSTWLLYSKFVYIDLMKSVSKTNNTE